MPVEGLTTQNSPTPKKLNLTPSKVVKWGSPHAVQNDARVIEAYLGTDAIASQGI